MLSERERNLLEALLKKVKDNNITDASTLSPEERFIIQRATNEALVSGKLTERDQQIARSHGFTC